MVNAWSLLWEEMNGTMDETYPIKSKYVDDPDPDFKVGKSNYDLLADDPYPVVGSVEYYQRPDLSQNIDLSDNDDQAAHHFGLNNEVKQSEDMTAHYFKYHEDQILKDIESYVSGTYRGHYTGTTHEYRNVQTLDLMAARDIASGFCQANIIKYGSRYGSKDGKEKKDLLKVIHYAMLLLHFDEHYGKPKMTTGNIDHTMP